MLKVTYFKHQKWQLKNLLLKVLYKKNIFALFKENWIKIVAAGSPLLIKTCNIHFLKSEAKTN